MRLIVGLSGASGIAYGIRLLQVLRNKNITTDLILTETASKIIELETPMKVTDVVNLATYVHDIKNLAAPIASGGLRINGMVIIPCSMKTLAGIAHGYTDNLLLRAADVILKEKRPLIIVPRETPLNVLHLENMLKLAKIGVVILPAMPAFYHKPKTIGDLIDHIVGKVLDALQIEHELYEKWKGI
ncbi:MAG: UbiX family flavin prenyltransferase [Candidatus Bathyarchaeia archaeon]